MVFGKKKKVSKKDMEQMIDPLAHVTDEKDFTAGPVAKNSLLFDDKELGFLAQTYSDGIAGRPTLFPTIHSNILDQLNKVLGVESEPEVVGPEKKKVSTTQKPKPVTEKQKCEHCNSTDFGKNPEGKLICKECLAEVR